MTTFFSFNKNLRQTRSLHRSIKNAQPVLCELGHEMILSLTQVPSRQNPELTYWFIKPGPTSKNYVKQQNINLNSIFILLIY